MEIGKVYNDENNLKWQSRTDTNTQEEEEEEETTKTTLAQVPETLTEVMEFLTGSWSLSVYECSKALNDKLLPPPLIHSNAGFNVKEEQNSLIYSPHFSSKDYGYIKKNNSLLKRSKTKKSCKKEEDRCQKAQVYAATSVAGVAATVAAVTASKGNGDSSMYAAISSATVLIASHCMEKAVEMGACRDQVLNVIQSGVNVRSNGDIRALTPAAATGILDS